MGNGPTIVVDGLRALQRAIRETNDTGLRAALKAVNKVIADKVVARALPNVPRRSGRLAARVKALAGERSASVKAGTPSATPYAPPVHWGWPKRHIKAQPFLTDAAASVERGVADDYEAALNELWAKVSAE